MGVWKTKYVPLDVFYSWIETEVLVVEFCFQCFELYGELEPFRSSHFGNKRFFWQPVYMQTES